MSNKGYLEHLTRKEWAEREQELLRKLHNQRVLTNYHRKKGIRSSCIDNAIEEAS